MLGISEGKPSEYMTAGMQMSYAEVHFLMCYCSARSDAEQEYFDKKNKKK